MAKYAIAELAEGEKGGFCPRGAVKELWQYKGHEVMLAGPAETGKTWGSLKKLNALMWKYNGAQAAMVRKTYSSMHGSVLQTYRRIVDLDNPKCPIHAYGGEKAEWYQYPNGSRIYVGGMDKPGKVLSSERDIIYINQAEELEVNDYETLLTRCTGRGSVMPYTQLMGDCNPGAPTHWIRQRSALKLLHSRHEDNPTLFDDDGVITEQGKVTLAILESLTGLRYKRLCKGLWVSAEGIVYEEWNPAIHIIDRKPIPDDWPRYWAIDFGYTHPFVWQAWAEDPDGRLIRYREIYHTKRLVEDHAVTILDVTKGEPRPRAIICDHDAEGRATFERKVGMRTTAAKKAVTDGIQAVQSRLRPAGDKRPRLQFMRDSLVAIDSELQDAKQPFCTEQEIEGYVWDTRQGQRKGEHPLKEKDDGCDTSRYLVAFFDLEETHEAHAY